MPMKNDPKEVRDDLKELLADTAPAGKKVIRAAIETIATMQADLRRLGLTEYGEGDDE